MSDSGNNSTLRNVRNLKAVVGIAEAMGANIASDGPQRVAQDQRLTAVLSDAFPDMTIAAAATRIAALDSWELRDNGEATDKACAALTHVLQCFIFTAPARSVADAQARIRYLRDFLDGGTPSETVLGRITDAIERDFNRLGLPEPGSVFASWPFANPFRK